jgi:hypothetical protein
MARPARVAPRSANSQRDDRTRGVLEIVTAILLGLVSVATAIGAYQAGQWGQESSDLAGVSQQLRDRNLALFLESQNTSRDDGERLFDALALYAEMSFYPERAEALLVEQDVIMAAASKPLADAFPGWRAAGYPAAGSPLSSPEYEAQTFAPAQSHNVASVVAYRASEVLEERSYRMTIVSVVFAVALLMLGVAGVSTRLGVSALLTGGGALAFLVGVAIVTFGIF